MGYIYLRTNLINGKHYVGQTKDIKVRNRQWKNLKKEYGGHAIENARKKYGTDGFSFEVLKECPNEDMNYWEMYYVKMYNSKKPYGYNATDGGDSTYERTDETKKKMSDAHRGKKRPAEVGAKLSAAMRGKPKSPEHIAKLSAAKRGKKRTEETKLKISAAHSKAVQALDKVTGEVVMEFASTKEAGRYGFNQGHVAACCRGEEKTHKGFIWRWKCV